MTQFSSFFFLNVTVCKFVKMVMSCALHVQSVGMRTDV